MRRNYTEAMTKNSFRDRFNYLSLKGVGIGTPTFEYLRYLNQRLYADPRWKGLRRQIIIRDNGCDLAHVDHPIGGKVIVHHIEPITIEDIQNRNPIVFDPENLICVSHMTHNAIHYSDYDSIVNEWTDRTPFDTCPWRK